MNCVNLIYLIVFFSFINLYGKNIDVLQNIMLFWHACA